MHIVYLDEVKYDNQTQPFYWLCALAFPEESIQEADTALSDVAKAYFGTPILNKNNEFHAREILHGKGPYKGHSMERRVDLYKQLIDVIAETPRLGRIEIRIDPASMIASDYKDKAFMFLVERVDAFMVQEQSLALLIADHDREIAAANVHSLSSYKAHGTHFAFSRDIERVVDGIHHTQSHHSRLLQLADVYAYTMAMYSADHSTYPRDVLIAHAKAKDNVLWPSKYKNWPTEQSWYRS